MTVSPPEIAEEYIPYCMGLTEDDHLYAAVCYARIKDGVVDARIVFYVYEDGEIYNAPVSGFALQPITGKPHTPLTKAVKGVCRAIATGGMSVYGIRDKVISAQDLWSGVYDGNRPIYGEHLHDRKNSASGKKQSS